MDGPLIEIAAQPPVPWRNNRGVTRDIATHRAPDGDILLQLGVANLQEDAPFSDFSGLDRVFTPLGHGVELRFDGGPWIACAAGCPVHFDGGRRTELRLPHGPAQAFNVLAARSALQASVRPLLLLPGTAVGPLPNLIACACLDGELGPIKAGMVWLVPMGAALPELADGYARLLLVEAAARKDGGFTWTGWGASHQPDRAPPG